MLFVIPGDGGGSSMIFTRRQADSLRGAGVIVAEFYLAARTSPGALLRERRRFGCALAEFEPDLVHAQYGSVTAGFCLLSTRLPVVITFRGSDLNPCRSISSARSLAGRLLSQLAALGAAGIICVSEQLRTRLWWRRESAQVVPSGVDTSIFHPRPKDQARAELGWPMDERVILFSAGRDPVTKGVDLAQTAAQKVSAMLDRVRLEVMAGGVPPTLIPTYLHAADCLLVTSLFEGSPNIVKEALACNLPVVSVEVGDVRQRLEGVNPSEVVRAAPEALVRGLVKVLTTPVRSNGFTKVREVSTTAMAGRILGVYQSVLRQTQSRLFQPKPRQSADGA